MATPQLTNIPQALAVQLTQSVALTEEQKLFREALENVKNSRAGNLSEFFTRLVHAKTVEDVTFAVKKEQEGNRVWRLEAGNKWIRRVEKFATCVLLYKGVADSIASMNASLASPIWGSCAFILGVLKDFPATGQSWKSIEDTLEITKLRFEEYFEGGIFVSPAFKRAIVRYYEVVIEFAIDAHKEFAAGIGKTLVKVVHRTLKTRLEDLDKVIHRAIYDVDQSKNHNHLSAIGKYIVDSRVNGTYLTASVTRATVSPTPRTTRSYGLPLSNTTFTGRKACLQDIWRSLHACHGAQGRKALYGLSGMGKTQILRKYAHDQIASRYYQLVVYIDSRDTTSVTSHIRSCMQLYAPRELEQAANEGPGYTAFKTWLLSQDDWLLIFDNVQCFDDVQQAIPEGDRGHILFSTQILAEAVQMSHNPYEIGKMDLTESIGLVRALIDHSPREGDKDPKTIEKLAVFAKGYPLLIEQIIHNAIFAGNSLELTLEWNKNKQRLLKQGNKSSLHERNLPVGVVIMQTFELVQAQSDKAEALFMILAYLQPSSISRNLVRNGSKQYEAFLRSQFTYDRGAYKLDKGEVSDLHDQASAEPELPTPKKKSLSTLFTKSRFPDWMTRRRSIPKSVNLPADDQTLRLDLLKACGPGTPTGRLFECQSSLDDALAILMRVNVIRQINSDSFEMHDLVSEMAKAIIEDRSRELEQQFVLTASTMVYLTLPHPERAYLNDGRSLILRYLPHAIACHSSLKSAGILNNCSIGPELSHIIASSMLKCGLAKYDRDYRQISPEAEAQARQQVFEYYLQAYEGYMAGWNRLRLTGSIQHDGHVFISAAEDRERLRRVTLFSSSHSYTDVHLLGRSAPWRAIQTAAKLAHLYRHEQSNPKAALRLWYKVLAFYEAAFGVDDFDTLDVKAIIYRTLTEDLTQWDAAHEFSLECIKQLIDWHPDRVEGNPPYNDVTWERLTRDHFVASYGMQAAHCCMKLAEQSKVDGDIGKCRAMARQAVVWYDLRLRQQINHNAGEYYTQRCEMMWLASAYEAAGDLRSCLYWYGRAVSCSMWKVMGMEMWIEASPQEVRDTVRTYHVAKSRLSDRTGIWSLNVDGVNVDLKEFLSGIDHKIEEWESNYELSVRQAATADDYTYEVEKVDWDAILAQPFEVEGCTSIDNKWKLEIEDDKENLRLEDVCV